MDASPEPAPPGASLAGRLLVGLQFLLIALLAWWALPALRSGTVPPGAWCLLVAGGAVGVWAVTANRLGNFNIRPDPKPGGRLVEHGPYRWIRHPMYTAVLAYGAACAWAGGTGGAWLAFALLAAVLFTKATLEERLMLAAHAGYAAYRTRTRRFLPGLI